jgi:hypothetical protein
MDPRATPETVTGAPVSPYTSSLRSRVFLLSPADSSGVRARLLLREEAGFELATRVRESGAPLGEIFSFISGLYFRGKLTYARVFSEPCGTLHSAIHIITSSQGLLTPETVLGRSALSEMAAVPIEASNPAYRGPLERDALSLRERLGSDGQVVLLGSIATSKYVEPLLEIFGEQLVFPVEFVGRGDMSRGGLLLRAARDRAQLSYISLYGARRHGPRLPKNRKPEAIP